MDNSVSVTLSQIEVESRYEEERKTVLLTTFISEDKSMNSNMELIKSIEKSKNIYRNLA